MPAQQAERNRDLEIATCTANRPVVPLRLQSRFLIPRGHAIAVPFPSLRIPQNFMRGSITFEREDDSFLRARG